MVSRIIYICFKMDLKIGISMVRLGWFQGYPMTKETSTCPNIKNTYILISKFRLHASEAGFGCLGHVGQCPLQNTGSLWPKHTKTYPNNVWICINWVPSTKLNSIAITWLQNAIRCYKLAATSSKNLVRKHHVLSPHKPQGLGLDRVSQQRATLKP